MPKKTKKKARKRRLIGQPPEPVFTDDEVKELAAPVGIKGADKIAAITNSLNLFASAVGAVSKGDHDAARQKAKKLAKLLDKMDAKATAPQGRELIFFHWNHPGHTKGWEADMGALARLKKTYAATAKSITGRKQSYPALHQAASDLKQLYEEYSGEPYTFMNHYIKGQYSEVTDGEKFVGRALKIIFPDITPAQKRTVMEGKNPK